MAWRFVIHNQASEPYDEAAIRHLVELKLVNAGTLAWREGLANWTPAGQIPELAALLPAAAPAAPAGIPPIPTTASAAPSPAAGVPPPPPGGSAGLWEDRARRFVYWCFRPRNGRPCRVASLRLVATTRRLSRPIARTTCGLICWLPRPRICPTHRLRASRRPS